jgi:hypothetical protein
VEKVEDVKTGLITSRRIIFTPNAELKEELAATAIQITCFDRTGKEVKRVTSTDDGTVEDNDATGSTDDNTGSSTTNTGGNGGGSNTGGGSTDPAPNPDPDGGSDSDE